MKISYCHLYASVSGSIGNVSWSPKHLFIQKFGISLENYISFSLCMLHCFLFYNIDYFTEIEQTIINISKSIYFDLIRKVFF